MVMDKDSCNPPEMGHQWPEARCFERTFVRDPEQQARAAKFLIGFYAVARWHYGSNPEKWQGVIDSIATLLSTFKERHPEFLQDGIEIDPECGHGQYHMDERLEYFVDKVLESQGEPPVYPKLEE